MKTSTQQLSSVKSGALKKGRAQLILPPTNECHVKHAILLQLSSCHGQ